ncbi:hypothetical protein B4U79_12872 [Dinothrombium tinctorium]|uniref:Uncharacterized protein n=1 Tax=Dinothrombium tinctorium TaxID=1965070 RepID=A0A443QSJ2_9ACAR|nr:hypothetical protein B4U79_12872 [Dinothrombium tinctorium]
MFVRALFVLAAILVIISDLTPTAKSELKNSEPNRINSVHYVEDYVDWSKEDLLQHPMDDTPRKKNRGLGHMCSYSEDCSSGCCLLNRETKIRSCQPRAIKGERCTSYQIKGDLYVDACPCESGPEYCSSPAGGVCNQ